MGLWRVKIGGGRVFYGYYLAAMSFVLGFVSGAMYAHSRGVFVRGQIEEFAVSRTEISLAFSAVQIAGAFASPVLGCLLDRFPVRNVMICGAIWLGAGFLVMSQAATVWQFAFLMALFMGLGSSSIGTSANTRLLVNWFDRHRGLALSVAVMGYSIAGIVMPPVAVWLMENAGWRHGYAAFGCVLLLVVLPLVAVMVRQRPQDIGQQPDGVAVVVNGGSPAAALAGGPPEQAVTGMRATLAAFRQFIRSRAFWGVALLFGSMVGVMISVNLHLFMHYTGLDLGEYRAALILSVTGVFMFVSKPLFGWLIDRLGARRSSLVALLVGVATMLVYALSTDFVSLLLGGVLLGFAFGALVPLQAALLSRLFEPAMFGRAYGALRLCIFPMTVAFTPLTGLTHDLTGSYTPAFAAFAALFAGVALLAPRLIPQTADT